MVIARDLSVRYGMKTAVDRVGFHASAGEWWMIVGPNGQVCSDREITDNQEGIVYADCDINKEIWLKNLHDVSGSYQRFDIFRYEINKTALEPLYIRKEDDLPDRDFYPYEPEEASEPEEPAEE